MPFPPPPLAAFSTTGNPISLDNNLISSTLWTASLEPGITGTPACLTVCLAVILSPSFP